MPITYGPAPQTPWGVGASSVGPEAMRDVPRVAGGGIGGALNAGIQPTLATPGAGAQGAPGVAPQGAASAGAQAAGQDPGMLRLIQALMQRRQQQPPPPGAPPAGGGGGGLPQPDMQQ